jgi:cellulose synthase/poly-beta-1,6-N-acetylglucosamine synthase-like glycosyltransferase
MKNNNLLKTYTILLPVYKEELMLDQLIKAIENLKYPKNLLQVLFLLEEDDNKTLQILLTKKIPNYFSILIVKEGGPKTKANACNYRLRHAHGELLVIYDAEDVPEEDQLLKAVKKFNASTDIHLSCLQAKLTFYNHSTNYLSQLCTLEYLIHFNFILPIFSSKEIPIPLGGTSNHFKTSALREVSGWDQYNVTEDADLTYRLYRKGYKIKMLDSYTYEETVIDIKSWIRQRSRWIKGHIMTFLVQTQTRFPNLKNTKKSKNTFSLYYFMGMVFILSFLHIFLIIILPFSFFYNLSYVNILLSKVCLFLYLYAYIKIPTTLIHREKKTSLLKVCLIYPFYLLLYNIASVFAIIQLIINPYKWEKTNHGNNIMSDLINKK